MLSNMKRCLAQLSLAGPWGTEHFWQGLEVNFARELAPGFTVADAVAGREDCFEDVDAPITMALDGPAPDGFTHVDVPADTNFSAATITPRQE